MGGEYNLGFEMRVFQMNTERPAFVLDRLSSFLISPLDEILRSRIADDPRRHVLSFFTTLCKKSLLTGSFSMPIQHIFPQG